MKKFIPAFISLYSVFAFADDHHHESHNFVQFSYVKESPNGEDVKPEGAGILVRVDLPERMFYRFGAEALKDGDVDVDAQSFALAYILNPDQETTYHIALLLEHEDEIEGADYSHGFGKGLEVGFHSELHPKFMLHGEAAAVYQDGEKVLEAELGLFYRFTGSFGFNIEYGMDDDSNAEIELGIRHSF